MDQLTKREWVILQQALLDMRISLDGTAEVDWDEDEDGPYPTADEIDLLAEKVGNMDHGE